MRAAPNVTFIVENVTRQRVIASRIHAARDSAARRQGLLNRTHLESEDGLWIDPCEAVHTFGMAVSLDAAFLDTDLRVKKIVNELKPNRIAFCLKASSVLEVRAGALKLLNRVRRSVSIPPGGGDYRRSESQPIRPLVMPMLVKLVLIGTAVAAAFFDLRVRRIPNWINVSGVVLGVALNTYFEGWPGALTAMGGLLAALCIYIPLYALKGMGAGDVKLMGAIGAIAGPANWLHIFIVTALIGGLASLALVFWRKRLNQTLMNISVIVGQLVQFKAPAELDGGLSIHDGKAMKMPHGGNYRRWRRHLFGEPLERLIVEAKLRCSSAESSASAYGHREVNQISCSLRLPLLMDFALSSDETLETRLPDVEPLRVR